MTGAVENWEAKSKRPKREMSDLERKVLALWNTDQYIAKECAKLLEIEPRRVLSILQTLRERGESVHNNSNRKQRPKKKANGAKHQPPEAFVDIQERVARPKGAGLDYYRHRAGLCSWPLWPASQSIGQVCGCRAVTVRRAGNVEVSGPYCAHHTQVAKGNTRPPPIGKIRR